MIVPAGSPRPHRAHYRAPLSFFRIIPPGVVQKHSATSAVLRHLSPPSYSNFGGARCLIIIGTKGAVKAARGAERTDDQRAMKSRT